MNLSTLIPNIHWIPVIVMTIVSFAFGAAWHQKFLFGKTWTAENKPTLDKKIEHPAHFWRNGSRSFSHFGRIERTGCRLRLAQWAACRLIPFSHFLFYLP